MQAIVCDKHSPAGALHLREVPRPVPGKGQVLVKIARTSLNAADYRSMAMGIIPKGRIFGADVAGVVEAIGSGVHQFQVGDPVFGDLSGVGFGGFAEYAAAPETAFALKPVSVPFEQAAALPMASLTALQALRDKGQIQAGKKVLIYGAGGGVGTFAVQLARLFGAEVSALCGPGNVDLVRSLGANHVFDYTRDDVTRSSANYDLILGINGSQPLGVYKRLLAPHGILVLVGGKVSQIAQGMIFGPFMSLGSRKIRSLAAKPNQVDLAFIIRLVAEGRIIPVIDRVYPLSQTAEAVNYLRQGHSCGKVIISIGQA